MIIQFFLKRNRFSSAIIEIGESEMAEYCTTHINISGLFHFQDEKNEMIK